jgi:hypothetical protein
MMRKLGWEQGKVKQERIKRKGQALRGSPAAQPALFSPAPAPVKGNHYNGTLISM